MSNPGNALVISQMIMEGPGTATRYLEYWLKQIRIIEMCAEILKSPDGNTMQKFAANFREWGMIDTPNDAAQNWQKTTFKDPELGKWLDLMIQPFEFVSVPMGGDEQIVLVVHEATCSMASTYLNILKRVVTLFDPALHATYGISGLIQGGAFQHWKMFKQNVQATFISLHEQPHTKFGNTKFELSEKYWKWSTTSTEYSDLPATKARAKHATEDWA